MSTRPSLSARSITRSPDIPLEVSAIVFFLSVVGAGLLVVGLICPPNGTPALVRHRPKVFRRRSRLRRDPAPVQLFCEIAIGSGRNDPELCGPAWRRSRTRPAVDVRSRSGGTAGRLEQRRFGDTRSSNCSVSRTHPLDLCIRGVTSSRPAPIPPSSD